MYLHVFLQSYAECKKAVFWSNGLIVYSSSKNGHVFIQIFECFLIKKRVLTFLFFLAFMITSIVLTSDVTGQQITNWPLTIVQFTWCMGSMTSSDCGSWLFLARNNRRQDYVTTWEHTFVVGYDATGNNKQLLFCLLLDMQIKRELNALACSSPHSSYLIPLPHTLRYYPRF